jgi:hypothetical protein
MEADSRLNQLSLKMHQRSMRLFEIMCSLIDENDGFTFKQPLLFKSSKVVLDRQRLKRNCVLLGIYLQHTLIDTLTDRAREISRTTIFIYLTIEHPDTSFEDRCATLERIYHNKMYIFDDIRNMKHPLHVGIPTLPIPGSVADNEFYRYSVWLMENSLLDPSPLLNATFTADTVISLVSWYKTMVTDLDPIDFIL